MCVYDATPASVCKVQCLKPVEKYVCSCITFPSENDGVPHEASLFIFVFRVGQEVGVVARVGIVLGILVDQVQVYMHE